MSEISKEALTTACAEKVKQLEFSVKQSAFDSVRQELETELAIARVALMALRERAETVHDQDMCDHEVFEKGASACLVDIPKDAAEIICRGISAATGYMIDWHYVGGRVHIKALRTAPPAPVAAGWIACSERMPEKDGNYWAWWSESKRQGPAWFIKSELQAQFQSSEITHWMPLPEAPGKEG